MIGLWLGLALVMTLTFPSLNRMVREHAVDVLPKDATAMVTARQMSDAFHEEGARNVVLVVLTNEQGLTPADEQVYGKLAGALRNDPADVLMVQDFLSKPALRDVMTSEDDKAWYLPLGIAGPVGSPQSAESYKRVTALVKQTVAGSTLTAHVTGPAATVGDLAETGENDLHVIEIATAVMVLSILLMVYRSLITVLLPLATIGLSLLVSQRVIALLADHGLGVSTMTTVLLTGIVMGAGTDYAVFLISRYHDFVRTGDNTPDEAVRKALTSTGKVIAASAATVGVTFMLMMFAQLGFFSTIGPSNAVAIAVSFIASVTLLPAILVLVARRGWAGPKREVTKRMWRRSGVHIVRRPVTHLVVSLVVLAGLASSAALIDFEYDDRKTLPADVESNVGYAAMDRHFPPNSTIAQYLLVQSPHDLRTPKALADLEQMAQRVSQVPDVALVRGVTRPTGAPLEQAMVSYQAGEVGGKLSTATGQINSQQGNLDALSGGATQLSVGLGEMSGEITKAVAIVTGVVDALSGLGGRAGSQATMNQVDSTGRLLDSMKALGVALTNEANQVNQTVQYAESVNNALRGNPVCDLDPRCVDSRGQLQQVIAARDNGVFTRLSELGMQLQSVSGTQQVDSTVSGLRTMVNGVDASIRALGGGDFSEIRRQLAELQKGATLLADGSKRVADGVQTLVAQTKSMGGGLADASQFLLALKHNAADPAMGGFNVPPEILAGDDFKQAAAAFVSQDGKTVRYLVQTKLNPFGTDAMKQVDAIAAAARSAQPNTSLSDASISLTGLSVVNRDRDAYYSQDMIFIAVTTIVVVLLVLMLLLRAVVAPLYLVASVVISYLSALGLGNLVFDGLFDTPLSWSVPAVTFIILVAVGADYNLLLISRIRDESPHGIRSGVIKTVGSTGAVITSAGLIFAASMFGLLFSSVTTMAQVGFIIGCGLLLDTFLVRTITVPAMAVVVGKKNWWPSKA